MQYRKLAFIGAGNMTKAILTGLIENGYPADKITVTAPSKTRRLPLEKSFAIQTTSDNLAAAKNAQVVILAVKPQLMAQVCKPLQAIDWSNKLVISIAAGIRCERLNQMLATQLNLVRVMPNTPTQIGLGMTGLFAPQHIELKDKDFAASLMNAVGQFYWLANENEMNLFTAIASSSPAYLFLLMEAMQQEAIKQGFNQSDSRKLIGQAMLGAANMVMENSETELSVMREQITSKAGVTAEALSTFNQYQFSDIVAKAIQAGLKRAGEMETLF